MKKLKIALLDDNKELLKDLKLNLESLEIVEVLFATHEAKIFREKFTEYKSQLDLILLDIELDGQVESGLDIAVSLGHPVLFVSGKSKEYLDKIETVNFDSDFPVESISKPVTSDKLKKAIAKISEEISWWKRKKLITLKIDGELKVIDWTTIVYLETTESNNKRVYFSDGTVKTLINLSFNRLVELGLDEDKFLKIHQAYRVNKQYIKDLVYSKKYIRLNITKPLNSTIKEELKVSDNYFPAVRNTVKSHIL